jgi:hypothetical protein
MSGNTQIEKRSEREELIGFIRTYDSFYLHVNFDLHSLDELRSLRQFIESQRVR